MKIKIEHASNPLNYGTNMMVTNFMYYLDEISAKDNIYLLDVKNDSDLKYYNYKKNNIYSQKIDYNFINHKNLFDKVMNKIKREYFFEYFNKRNIQKLINNCNYLVVLGGDDLSEYYGIENLNRELNRLNYLKDKLGMYLIGQTIGPFYNERIKLASESLNNIPIYSRDPWTTKYLKKNLNIEHIVESSDLAFLDLPNQDNSSISDSILNKYSLLKNEYIVLIPSGLYKSYCNDEGLYIENWCGVVKDLLNKHPEKKVVLLPHVLSPAEVDDRNIIRKIENEMGNKENIIYIYDEMTPLEARFILGNSILSITGRMHGAISTLQMRKPTISIAYSVKYKGVIGDGLDLNNLIISGEDNETWKKKIIKNNVDKKVDYILDNYKDIIIKIDKNVTECEKKVYSMLEKISDEINSDLVIK